MLKELKFVQGAVAKKDLLPAMTHFRVEDGFVRAYNGTMALCSPIALDVNCVPKADALVKAISNCKDTIALSMTPAGRLRVKSGSFVAYVECVEGDTPHVMPDGETIEVDGDALLEAAKTLYHFVGNDASRPWTNGMLLKGQSAFATNNVVVTEFWIGTDFPIVVNIPRDALKEMIRVNEAPTHLQMTSNSLTLHYADQRWIRTQLLPTDWPDLGKILNHTCTAAPLPEGFFDALETLKPVADGLGRIYMSKGLMRTHLEEQTGALYELDGLEFDGIYNLTMLLLLKDHVTKADFTRYPMPCLFFGDRVRGALAGLHN